MKKAGERFALPPAFLIATLSANPSMGTSKLD